MFSGGSRRRVLAALLLLLVVRLPRAGVAARGDAVRHPAAAARLNSPALRDASGVFLGGDERAAVSETGIGTSTSTSNTRGGQCGRPGVYGRPKLVGPDRCCSPHHPTHLEPSLLESSGTLLV